MSAYSVGEAETLIPLHDRADTARARAIGGLRPAAERALVLAACPHCKAREPAADRRARLVALSGALASAALIPIVLAACTFMIAALGIADDGLDVDGAIIILVGLAFAAISWLLVRAGVRKRIAHARDMADATVMWLGQEQEPEPVPEAVTARPAENGWPFA